MLDNILSVTFCVISGLVLIVKEGIFSWSGILWPLAGWCLWLGSGCLAATAAELLKKPVILNFLLGLLIPYIYPVWFIRHNRYAVDQEKIAEEAIEAETKEARKTSLADRFQAAQEKREAERRARLGTAEKAPQAAAAPAVEIPPAGPAAAPPETGNEMYEILYIQPVDENGSRPGPFQFMLKDGTQLDIDCIRSMTADHMICVVTATGKSVRFRYAQIDSVARYENA